MQNREQLEQDLKDCHTSRQVVQAIYRNGFSIYKDDSEEIGSFSVWLTETLRVYRSSRGYVIQTWQPVKMNYSGAPMYPSARRS